ncbi:MAG: efflux RND transporter periplasmic adaptor subunit, partial [Elusimicrobia bacterium]|nr:efflux RND transporter periplasmic adaptor subunit [Elusimicrobiota bacterium]
PAVPAAAPAAAPVTPPVVPATTPRPVSAPQPPLQTPLPPQPPRTPPREEQTFGAPKNEEVFGATAPVQARSAQPPAPTPLPPQPPTMRPQAVSTPAATGIKGFKDFSGAKPQPDKPSGGFKNWFFGHKWISISISVVLAAGLVWGSVALYKKFSGGKKEAAEENKEGALSEVSVNVMQVVPAPFQDILTAVGTVAGGSEIELRFQTEGNLRTLNFREGDSVKAGQLIAQLDQAQASIKLERARSEYYRYEKLYALGGVSKDRLDEARVQFDYAQTEMAKTVLRATQDGIFGDKGVEVGEFITPQKKVGTLVSLGTVMIRIGVIEKEIDKIFPGQVVTATVETYPNVEFKGKVENISPLVQGQTKTLMVEARVPNTGKLLLPGMFARTKIIIFEKDHVISVPNDALEKTQEGYRLYIVGKENKAEVRPVQVSYVSLTHSVISSGIEPGEQVIIQRPQELKEGAPLKVVEVEKPVSKLEGMGAGAGGDQGHSESAGEESPR